MDNKQMIAFGKEQLEIFGEGSQMHEFITRAIKIDEPMNREEFENFCETSHFFKLGDDGVFEKLIVDDSKL